MPISNHFPFPYFLFFVLLEMGSCYVAQGGLKLSIFLYQTPRCWDYTYVPPHLVHFCLQHIFWQALICVLSLWVCLFCLLYIYGHLHLVYFTQHIFNTHQCSVIISTEIRFMSEKFAILWISCTLFICCWTSKLFSLWPIVNKAAVNDYNKFLFL